MRNEITIINREIEYFARCNYKRFSVRLIREEHDTLPPIWIACVKEIVRPNDTATAADELERFFSYREANDAARRYIQRISE